MGTHAEGAQTKHCTCLLKSRSTRNVDTPTAPSRCQPHLEAIVSRKSRRAETSHPRPYHHHVKLLAWAKNVAGAAWPASTGINAAVGGGGGATTCVSYCSVSASGGAASVCVC